jgi:hypothetical protein
MLFLSAPSNPQGKVYRKTFGSHTPRGGARISDFGVNNGCGGSGARQLLLAR